MLGVERGSWTLHSCSGRQNSSFHQLAPVIIPQAFYSFAIVKGYANCEKSFKILYEVQQEATEVL